MSEYVENTERLNEVEEEVEQEVAEETSKNEADFTVNNQFEEEIVTAVLLIMNKSGQVLPITTLDNLKMERVANAHEILRMCADVKDQISAVRVVGELAQIFSHINSTSLKNVAELMGVKLNQEGESTEG